MKLAYPRRSFPVLAIAMSVLLCACLALHQPNWWQPTRVAAQENGKQALEFVPEIRNGGYVISERNGQSVCQEATPSEAAQMRPQTKATQMRVIYPGRSAARTAQQTQLGLRITLRATAQLEAFPEAKAAFIRAAQNWENQILSPLSIVIDVDYGPTFFGENYRSSDILGQTATQLVGSATGYNSVRTALNAGASSLAEAAVLATLPTGQLPTDQGNLTAVVSDAAVFRALGLLTATANPELEQTQLGEPPRIGFNSNFSFDFDPSNGISPNRVDFDATATHEIGHALGFGSLVGEKELEPSSAASVTILDYFRFRPGVTMTTFSTAQRILASGGSHAFYAGGAELAMSTGRTDGTGGDGHQGSHWKADEITGVYIGVMDPTLSRGVRYQITANDLHAFDTIGYRVRSAQQQIDAAPRPLDFGDAALNTSVERTLAVHNTGGQPLQVTGMTVTNAQFSLVSPGTSFTVAANSVQNVVFRFTPTANGNQTATLTILSNDPNRPNLTVSLTGFGGVQPTQVLTSGSAFNGALTAPSVANSCQLDATQYTIQVPANATQLRVTLTGNQDLDLYARFGSRITGSSPNFTADHVSDSPNSSETITVTPGSAPTLRAGTYFVGVSNCGPGAANFALTATVTGAAALATVSAASFSGTELAAETIASAFGQNLATANASAATTPLPTTLAGSTVKVRDSGGVERLAPLFFVSAGQINFQVPAGTALGTATITVTSSSGAVSIGTINIVAVTPGLFSANANGQGAAAAVGLRVQANGSQTGVDVSRLDAPTNRFVTVPIDLGPATDQVFLVMFGTGIRYRSSLNAVTAQIGGAPAQVAFAGAQGSLVGVDQVNILIPRSLIGRGEIDVVLTTDGKNSNTVRVNIQ